MRNCGSGWARAAQAGTLALVALVTGCTATDEAPEPKPSDAAVGRGGSGGTGGGAGEPAIDAGGLPQCVVTRPAQVGACVSTLEPLGGTVDDFSGVVQAIESSQSVCPGGGIGDPAQGGSVLVLSDGDTTIRVGVSPPLSGTFVRVGDAVTIEHESQVYFEAPRQGRLMMRGADGELLLWVVMTSEGFGGLAVPELAVRSGDALCQREESSCGTVTQSSIVARSGDSGDVSIGWGERADVGDYIVVHGDNTIRPQSCVGYSGQFVVFAAARKARACERDCEDLEDAGSER